MSDCGLWCLQMSYNVAEDGIPTAKWYFYASEQESELTLITEPFVTFWLSLDKKLDPAPGPYKLGKPLVLSTLDILDPVVSGRASEPMFVLSTEEQGDSSFAVTFHCLATGTTMVTVVLPLLPHAKQPRPRAEPVQIVCGSSGRMGGAAARAVCLM